VPNTRSKSPKNSPCRRALIVGPRQYFRATKPIFKACFLGRIFCAKELCAHVVVDPNNARAILRESVDRFRTDQFRRSRDDDCAHLVYSTIILAITQDDCRRMQVASPEANGRNLRNAQRLSEAGNDCFTRVGWIRHLEIDPYDTDRGSVSPSIQIDRILNSQVAFAAR
jgi:hypothetical protein